MENINKFKVVYKNCDSTYSIWYTNGRGEWICNYTSNTYSDHGEKLKSRSYDWGLVNEKLVWKIDYWNHLGYKFIGIEQDYED